MTLRSFRRIYIMLLMLLLPLALNSLPLPPRPASAAHALQRSPLPSSSTSVYLPTLAHGTGTRSSVFGVEINGGLVGAVVQPAADASVSWARYNNINWSDVESSPGTRNWAVLQSAEAELIALSGNGMQPIVTIKGTPSWAQQIPGSTCGPIRPDAQGAFASFMHDLVARYSVPPYNVRYWEIWNETDDPITMGSPPYGCWGNPSDAYYGGGAYGNMLKIVYPAIKAANPQAHVLVGGLLMYCDPVHPPAGQSCASSNFLEGILRAGAGTAFDLMAYHDYAAWSTERTDWDLSSSLWPQGGNLLGKLSYIRTLLQRYGVPTKPIIMDEGGLLYYGDPAGAGNTTYYADQANDVVRLYTRAWAHGLVGAVWYTLNGPGFHNDGLLDSNQQPRPAYAAFKFLSNLLQGTTYAGSLSQNNIEGYEFQKSGTIYRTYWTNDSSTATLPLPAGTWAVYSKTGQVVPTSGTSITISFEPVIIQLYGP